MATPGKKINDLWKIFLLFAELVFVINFTEDYALGNC